MKRLFSGLLLVAGATTALAADPGFPAPQGDPSIIIPGERLDRLYKVECGITEGAASAPTAASTSAS